MCVMNNLCPWSCLLERVIQYFPRALFKGPHIHGWVNAREYLDLSCLYFALNLLHIHLFGHLFTILNYNITLCDYISQISETSKLIKPGSMKWHTPKSAELMVYVFQTRWTRKRLWRIFPHTTVWFRRSVYSITPRMLEHQTPTV